MSAQLEDGYTRIANEILEHMAMLKLNATQFRVLLVIWRYTYGFQRKEHELSLSFIANAVGCDKRQLQRELTKLEEMRIINQKIKNGAYRIISFNKNHSDWSSIGKSTNGENTNGESTNGKSTNPSIGESTNPSIGESTNGTIGESTNQERKKENFKENIITTGDEFKIVLDAFCDIHDKAEHQVYSQISDMQKILDRGIPSQTIITVMKEQHAKKAMRGESVNSFSYYHKAIIEHWEGGQKVEELGRRTERFRSSGIPQATGSRGEGESKIYRGKWDDTDVQMPKVSG